MRTRALDSLVSEIRPGMSADQIVERLISWVTAVDQCHDDEQALAKRDEALTKERLSALLPGFSDDRIQALVGEKFSCRHCIAGTHREELQRLLSLLHSAQYNLRSR